MRDWVRRHGKAIVSFLFAVGITAWQQFTGDHNIDPKEATVIGLAFGNALMVYVVPLVPEYPWVKSAAGAIIAVATAGSALALGGFSYDEIGILVLTALQALGIKIAPAESDNGVDAPTGLSDG